MTLTSKSRPDETMNSFDALDLKRIRGVAFDAVGTVMYPAPSVAEAYGAAIRRHCGIEVSQEVVSAVVRDALAQRSAAEDLRTNEDVEEEFWAALIRQFCPSTAGFRNCFDELFAHFGNAEHWQCFGDVQATISELRDAGLVCAVASNFDLRLNSVCDGLPELSAMSHRIISSVVGWRKPAPQFFAAVAECLQLRPEEILMVGDDRNNDVLGAVAAGMSAAWVCRTAAPRIDLPQSAFRVSSLDELTCLLTGKPATPQKTEQGPG
jgi:putative hydrolase of the HAD superfamily